MSKMSPRTSGSPPLSTITGLRKRGYVRQQAAALLEAEFLRAPVFHRAGPAVNALEIAGVGGLPEDRVGVEQPRRACVCAYSQFTRAWRRTQRLVQARRRRTVRSSAVTLTKSECSDITSLGHRFLLPSATVTCFAALPAGYACFIASPLMSSALHMSGTPTLAGDLFLLFGVHGGKPSKPSGHKDTSLHPWATLTELFTELVLTPATNPLN